MPNWSVVIPSDEPENLNACVQALVDTHPGVSPEQIIVVTQEIRDYPLGLKVKMIQDPSPFNFSRRVNLGAHAAGNSDVFLMGDDVRLLSANTIARVAEEAPFRILATSVRGRCGPWWQREGNSHPSVPFVSFIAVYLTREILEIVGPMWEGFAGYGYDDTDYCVRARAKGFSPGVADIAVEHSVSTPSTFLKRYPREIGDMENAARRAFTSKHSWCSFPEPGLSTKM